MPLKQFSISHVDEDFFSPSIFFPIFQNIKHINSFLQVGRKYIDFLYLHPIFTFEINLSNLGKTNFSNVKRRKILKNNINAISYKSYV